LDAKALDQYHACYVGDRGVRILKNATKKVAELENNFNGKTDTESAQHTSGGRSPEDIPAPIFAKAGILPSMEADQCRAAVPEAKHLSPKAVGEERFSPNSLTWMDTSVLGMPRYPAARLVC